MFFTVCYISALLIGPNNDWAIVKTILHTLDKKLPIGNIVGPANACYGVLNGLYSITGLGAPAGYTYQWSSTGGAASNANSASTNFLFTSELRSSVFFS
jgi:hypothetical protein